MADPLRVPLDAVTLASACLDPVAREIRRRARPRRVHAESSILDYRARVRERISVARRAPTGWRLHLSIDAVLWPHTGPDRTAQGAALRTATAGHTRCTDCLA